MSSAPFARRVADEVNSYNNTLSRLRLQRNCARVAVGRHPKNADHPYLLGVPDIITTIRLEMVDREVYVVG